MRITSVNATPVKVPATRTGVFSQRVHTDVPNTIVEVETDEDLVGLGETREIWAAPIINERFAPALVGMETHDRQATFNACMPYHMDAGYPERVSDLGAYAAIEIALYDLLGKKSGLPVYQLLGGAVREKALFVAYSYTVDPVEGHSESEVPGIMAERAAGFVAESRARMFEFKIGVYSVGCDIETVLAVREALGPEVELAVDANMVFTFEEARRFLHGVRKARLANIEEPVADLGQVERLREEFSVPVSTHCYDLDFLKAHPKIDAVVTDLHLQGGFDKCIELMVGLSALSRRFWQRSRWELGISWAAMCHLGIARAEIDRPSQALISWAADDLVVGETWHVRDGGVRPPDTPGLGVELDREALERYAV